jgi:hypothetical protein
MNIAAIWMGLPKWVRDAIMIGAAVLAVIFLGKQYVKGKQDEAVRKNNDRRDKEAAEVEREIVSNISENTDEVVREADAVRSHPSASVLPNQTGATLSDPHYRD